MLETSDEKWCNGNRNNDAVSVALGFGRSSHKFSIHFQVFLRLFGLGRWLNKIMQ